MIEKLILDNRTIYNFLDRTFCAYGDEPDPTFDDQKRLENILIYSKNILENTYKNLDFTFIKHNSFMFNIHIKFKGLKTNVDVMESNLTQKIETDCLEFLGQFEKRVFPNGASIQELSFNYGEPFNHSIIDISLLHSYIITASNYSPFFGALGEKNPNVDNIAKEVYEVVKQVF